MRGCSLTPEQCHDLCFHADALEAENAELLACVHDLSQDNAASHERVRADERARCRAEILRGRNRLDERSGALQASASVNDRRLSRALASQADGWQEAAMAVDRLGPADPLPPARLLSRLGALRADMERIVDTLNSGNPAEAFEASGGRMDHAARIARAALEADDASPTD